MCYLVVGGHGRVGGGFSTHAPAPRPPAASLTHLLLPPSNRTAVAAAAAAEEEEDEDDADFDLEAEINPVALGG